MMSREYDKEIQEDLKCLIKQLFAGSVFEENNVAFKKVLKHWNTTFKKSNAIYYPNKQDIDKNMDKMIEKFCFNGCFRESEILRKIYKNYIITDDLPKDICMNRLSVVKFLLCLSETPTQKLLETHYEFKLEEEEKEKDKEKDINWGEYLNEGIERWNPNFDESEDSDIDSTLDEADHIEPISNTSSFTLVPTIINSTDKFCTMDLKTSRDELTASVQHSWYHSGNFQMVPESHLREANTGILWEEHLRDEVKSLILLDNPSVISEYNVIREILWQLWCPHTSTVFELCGNAIKPKTNITLSSVRRSAFYSFMESFVPYIDILNYFRDFKRSLGTVLDENVCVTYRCYWNSLNSIIAPIYKKLCEIENTVWKQEETYTLQNLALDLGEILEPLKVLKEIHETVILDSNKETPLKCATSLLARLHESLHFCCNKLEQDLKTTLFLESLYHYFNIINSWLMADNLNDYSGEFVIEKKLGPKNQPNFVIKEDVEEFCKNNTFLKIFLERVLQIGRNISFLRILGKYDMIGDFTETIYEEFVVKILQKLAIFYNIEIQNTKIPGEKHVLEEDTGFSENPIDTTDGFLMHAFADFFGKKEESNISEKVCLFEKLSNTTKNLFPKTNFFENLFLDILNERFTVSGLMVKKLLVEQHFLEKQFEFLGHLYLFWDDLIFPFYRKIFEDTVSSKSNKIWAYELCFTSHIQDIFIDLYPEFYEKCSVTLKDGYALCGDPVKVSEFVNVNFEVTSPLNIVIPEQQIEKYQDIFQFLLTLKFAIHTVNYLVFTALEPKSTDFKMVKQTQTSTKKLKQIKFCLINILNSLQHFIFGSILGKNLRKFELDFEKAKDLSDIIESHGTFINSIHGSIKEMKNCVVGKNKSNNVLSCIRILKLMWNDEKYVTVERLNECKTMYDDFYQKICPIVFPVYLYDY